MVSWAGVRNTRIPARAASDYNTAWRSASQRPSTRWCESRRAARDQPCCQRSVGCAAPISLVCQRRVLVRTASGWTRAGVGIPAPQSCVSTPVAGTQQSSYSRSQAMGSARPRESAFGRSRSHAAVASAKLGCPAIKTPHDSRRHCPRARCRRTRGLQPAVPGWTTGDPEASSLP